MAHDLGMNESPLDLEAEASLSLASLRILVAEHHPLDRQLMLQMLRQLGYNASAVGDGDGVLEALKTADYDVILLSVQMSAQTSAQMSLNTSLNTSLDTSLQAPNAEVFATSRRIHQTVPASHLPYLIAMAAHPEAEVACQAAGIAGYLLRPIALGALCQALEAAAQHRLQQPDLQRLRLADLEEHKREQTEQTLPDERQNILDRGALETLRQIAGDSADVFLAEMIHSYLQEVPQLMGALEGAIAQANFAEILHHTHSLKSMSAALGATQLAEQCQQMEILAHQPKAQANTIRILAALQRSLSAELDDVGEALQAVCPGVENA